MSSPLPHRPHLYPPLPLKHPLHLPPKTFLSLPVWLMWIYLQIPLKLCAWRSLPHIFTTISCRWRCSGSGLIMVSRYEALGYLGANKEAIISCYFVRIAVRQRHRGPYILRWHPHTCITNVTSADRTTTVEVCIIVCIKWWICRLFGFCFNYPAD